MSDVTSNHPLNLAPAWAKEPEFELVITVRDSVKIVEMIARDKITWRRDDFWGYDIPTEIPGVELERFDPKNYYSDEQIEQLSQSLKIERLAWLSQFPSLSLDILQAIKP